MRLSIGVILIIFFSTSSFCCAKSVDTTYCYDQVWSFSKGLSLVQREGKFGFINKKGKEVIRCQYASLEYFNPVSHLASFKDTTQLHGFINRHGKVIVEPIYQEIYGWDKITGLVYVKRKEKYGFMNKTGREVVPCMYDKTNGTPEHFYNGIVEMKKNGKYGILDKKGHILVDFDYDYFIGFEWLKGFPEKFMAAKKDTEYYYIDMHTFKIIKTGYEYAGEFSDGMATVKKGGKYGYIDSTFCLVIPCIYTVTRKFSEGLAEVLDSSGKWGYVSKSGKTVVPCVYEKEEPFSCGRAMVFKDSMAGFIDRSGKVVIPFEFSYDMSKDYHYKRSIGFQDGICAIRKNGKYGIMDTAGKVLLDYKYESVLFATDYQLNLANWYPIAENYALAVVNKKCFIVDKTGKLYGDNGSSRLIYFVEGLSFICDTTNKCGFINTKGEVVIPYSFDYYEYSTFYNGYAVVKQNGKFGIIDRAGKIIVPTIYDRIFNFNDKLANAKKGDLTYFINRRGKIKLTMIEKG